MTAAWTDERRQKQREAIHRWAPWDHSSGPKTVAGKAASTKNNFRHGGRSAEVRLIRKTLALCRGPGNLTRALGISLLQNRRDLVSSDLRIEDAGLPDRPVAWSRRIGINVGVEHEWRCYVEGSAAVSGRVNGRR